MKTAGNRRALRCNWASSGLVGSNSTSVSFSLFVSPCTFVLLFSLSLSLSLLPLFLPSIAEPSPSLFPAQRTLHAAALYSWCSHVFICSTFTVGFTILLCFLERFPRRGKMIKNEEEEEGANEGRGRASRQIKIGCPPKTKSHEVSRAAPARATPVIDALMG